jgi:hypothetical protein
LRSHITFGFCIAYFLMPLMPIVRISSLSGTHTQFEAQTQTTRAHR